MTDNDRQQRTREKETQKSNVYHLSPHLPYTLTPQVSGAVAGLVVVTPGAGFVDSTGAFIMGLLAGPGCYYGAQLKVSGCLSLNNSINQSIIRSINHSLTRSINQSINNSINQSLIQSITR